MEVRIILSHFVIILAGLVALGHCLHLKSSTYAQDSNGLADIDYSFASLISNKKMVKRELSEPIVNMKGGLNAESSTKLDNLIETNEGSSITDEKKEMKTGSEQSFTTADVVTFKSTPVSRLVSVPPTAEGSVGNAPPIIHTSSTSNKLHVNSKQILQASAFSTSHSDAAEKTTLDNVQTILSSTMIATTPTSQTEVIHTSQTEVKTGLSTKQLHTDLMTDHRTPGETTETPSINPSKTLVHNINTMSELVTSPNTKEENSMTYPLLVTKGLSTSRTNMEVMYNSPSPHLSIVPTSINKVATVHSTIVPTASHMPESKSSVGDMVVTYTAQVLSSRVYEKNDLLISSPQTEGLDSTVSSTIVGLMEGLDSTVTSTVVGLMEGLDSTVSSTVVGLEAQHGAGSNVTESATRSTDSVYATDPALPTLINGDIYILDGYSNSAKVLQSSVLLHLASTDITTSDIYGSVDTPHATPASTSISAMATQETQVMSSASNTTTDSESVTDSAIANSTTKATVFYMTDTVSASVGVTTAISPEKSAAANISLNSSDVVSSPSGIVFTSNSFVASSGILDLTSEVVPHDTTSMNSSSVHYVSPTLNLSSVLSINQTSMIPTHPSSAEPSVQSLSVAISSQPLDASTVPVYPIQDSIQSTQFLIISDSIIIVPDNGSASKMILETPSAENHSAVISKTAITPSEYYTIIQATPSVDVIVTKYVPPKEGSTNATKDAHKKPELSLSASFGIAAGCLIGFWLILGPIICIVCRCRDKSKDGRKSKANGHNHMENGITEAMIMKELHREYKEKDSPTLTNGAKYHPLTEENTQLEALRHGNDSPIMFIDSD